MSKKNIEVMVFTMCFLLFCYGGMFSFAEEPGEGALFTQAEITPQPQTKEISKKISLDLKGVDILDVLKIFSKRSDLNIVAGPNVRGKVTIFLKNVDARDALEIILAANNLAYEKREGIINVMTERDYELLYGERYHDKKALKTLQLKYAKAGDISKALNQVKTKLGRVVVDEGSNTLILIDVPERIQRMEEMATGMDAPTETEVFALNYAKAEDIKPKLEEVLTKGVGMIKVDERMNKIVITDLPKKVEEISEIIAAFDEKTPEVLIEAKIIQVLLADDFSLGMDWDAIFAGIDATTSGTFDIIAAGSFGGSFTVGTLPENGYSAMIEVLQTIAKTDTLSTPRIVVLNNEEAKILVGTKEAYVTTTVTQTNGTSSTAESVTFIDVGVTLAVTPQINPDGFITMEIRPEVSSVDRTITTAQGNVIPIVRTSESETKVMVKDGRTIVIAGLIENKKIDTVNKIPFLGDIPILGTAFRSKKVEIDKTELAIFLTPHIVSGDVDDPEITPTIQKPVSSPEPTVPPISGDVDYPEVATPFQEPIPSTEPPTLREREAYIDYYATIREKIQQLATETYPKGHQNGEIWLSFVILANGSLKEEPVILKGEDELLKKAAVRSVKEASPFSPFPKKLALWEATFEVVITYE